MIATVSGTPHNVSPASGVPKQPQEYRILIIEDDRDIAELLHVYLQDLPAQADIVRDGQKGLAAIIAGGYALVTLDVRLPGLNGLELCRRVRRQGLTVPILMISARGAESDRIAGLELGADDYVVKPFSPGELKARARALLRRASMGIDAGSPPGEARVGDLRIDPARRQVWIGDKEIRLTPKEFELLYTLAVHPGRVFTRAELLRTVWGLPYEGYEHNVTLHANRLREKIEEDPQNPRRLVTVWGIGYKISD